PGQDQHFQRAVVVGGVADLRQALVHRERQGIARLRPVEGDAADAALDLVEEIGRGGVRFRHDQKSWNIRYCVGLGLYRGCTAVCKDRRRRSRNRSAWLPRCTSAATARWSTTCFPPPRLR